jgi:hypothetical protein
MIKKVADSGHGQVTVEACDLRAIEAAVHGGADAIRPTAR